MIDIQTLQYFRAAFEGGSFSAAARALDVSQPSVSIAIGKLETRIGKKLFERGRDGLKPTCLAQEVYAQSASFLDQVGEIERLMSGAQIEILRIHCHADVRIESIANKLDLLRRSRRNLTIQFTDDAARADLIVCSRECTPEGCSFHLLWSERYGLGVSARNPLTRGQSIQLEDLQDMPLISRPYCPAADRFVQEFGSKVSVIAEATNDAQLIGLIEAGLGVALIPESHATDRRDLVVLPLSEVISCKRDLGIAFRKTAFARQMADSLANAG